MVATAAPTDALRPLPPDPTGEEHARGQAPLGLTVTGLVLGLVFAAPLGYIVVRNLSEGSALLEELTDPDTLGPLWRSLSLASAVALCSAMVATALAWVLQRTDLPARRVLRVLAPLPLVFPSFVGAAALLSAFGPGGMVEDLSGLDVLPELEGFAAAWLALTLFTYPLVYLPVAARLRALPPSLEESARLLGRRPTELFGSVVLPQILPAVRAGGLLVFLYTLSDFGVVQQLRYDTLTRAIYETRLLDRPRSFALALVLAVVAIVVVVGERLAARRMVVSAVDRHRRPVEFPLGRWRWPVFAVVVAFFANALGGPVASLFWWAWRGTSNRPDPWEALTSQLRDLGAPAANTAVVGVVGAAIAVAAVLPVAWLCARYRTRAGGMANALVVGGYALPGISIALAMAFWALNAPGARVLYQSLPLLVAAYVVHFGAQAMRSSQVAVAALPVRVGEAARMLGAGRIRRVVGVEIRVMLPGLLAGAGLVLLSIMKELPATLILHPTGFDTLTTEIWPAIEGHFLARAGVASLVLVALSAALTWLLVVRRSEALE